MRWPKVLGWGAAVVGIFITMAAVVGPLGVLMAARAQDTSPKQLLQSFGFSWGAFVARQIVTAVLGVAAITSGLAFLRRKAWAARGLQVVAAFLCLAFVWGLGVAAVSFVTHPRGGAEVVLQILGAMWGLAVCVGLALLARFLGRSKVQQYLQKDD